jgi:hypothetical protein
MRSYFRSMTFIIGMYTGLLYQVDVIYKGNLVLEYR